MSNPERDRSDDDARSDEREPRSQAQPSGPIPRASSKSLLELDDPYHLQSTARSSQPAVGVGSNVSAPAPANENAQAEPSGPPSTAQTERMGPGEVEALDATLSRLTEAPVPDSDAEALTDVAAADGPSTAPTAPPNTDTQDAPPEPEVSTRAATHVAQERWFDSTLAIPGLNATANADARQRVAWRFKAAHAAWKLLLPMSPTPELRAELGDGMRSYERLLRESGPIPEPREGQQLSDTLHSRLNDTQLGSCDRALTGLENLLLAVDESMSEDSFRAHFCRPQEQSRTLLRYARFLGSRRFGIGYRRDRFEALALELLTARLPSGKLVLMPRKRAGQVLQQLLRGLYRPTSGSDDLASAIAYLLEALDRLASYASAKQFFDSGFFLDVYGYKISMHDRITSPEYLYLCVALNVEIHNRLQAWSELVGTRTGGSLAALLVQLRAQQEATQAVFADFHRPLAGTASSRAARNTGKKAPTRPEPQKKPVVAAHQDHSRVRLIGASVFVLGALAANLYSAGYLHRRQDARPLPAAELKELSPLLQSGHISDDGKHFAGMVTRPAWRRLAPRERGAEAVRFATALKQRGIDHAEVLAYQTRAMQVDYGTVVYVDDAK